MTPEQAQFLAAAWPYLFAAASGFATIAIGIIGYLIRQAWQAHKLQLAALEKAVKALDSVARATHTRAVAASREARVVSVNLLKVQGALESTQLALERHAEKQGNLAKEVQAIFRFVDAPGRATDASRG